MFSEKTPPTYTLAKVLLSSRQKIFDSFGAPFTPHSDHAANTCSSLATTKQTLYCVLRQLRRCFNSLRSSG